MSSKAWSIVRDVFTVERLTVATAVCIAAHIWHTLPDNIHSLLQQCEEDLGDIRTQINELSPDRRECLRIAAQQGKCLSIEQLKCRLHG